MKNYKKTTDVKRSFVDPSPILNNLEILLSENAYNGKPAAYTVSICRELFKGYDEHNVLNEELQKDIMNIQCLFTEHCNAEEGSQVYLLDLNIPARVIFGVEPDDSLFIIVDYDVIRGTFKPSLRYILMLMGDAVTELSIKQGAKCIVTTALNPDLDLENSTVGFLPKPKYLN